MTLSRPKSWPAWAARGVALGAVLASWAVSIAASQATDPPSRAELRREFEAGNFKDAFEGFRRLAINPADDSRQVGEDLASPAGHLQQLGRLDKLDDFREAVDSRPCQELAASLVGCKHLYGKRPCRHAGRRQISPRRQRRPNRSTRRSQAVNATPRDRVRALQLLAAAMPLADADPARADVANLYLDLGARVAFEPRPSTPRGNCRRSPISPNCPTTSRVGLSGESPQGAPVDADNAPVFYSAPKRWTDAANDGQRWRWALDQAAECDPRRLNPVRWETAQFFQSQFGVETLADYPQLFDASEELKVGKGNASADASIYALAYFGRGRNDRTAGDAASSDSSCPTNSTPSDLSTNRRRAANRPRRRSASKHWRGFSKTAGNTIERPIIGGKRFANMARDARIRAAIGWTRFVGNWGRFEPGAPQPAGRGATVDFRFRNGRQVSFEAHAIKLDKLLADVKAYLKSNPRPIDSAKIDVQSIGARLMQENQQQYIGAKVAAWDLELQPRRNHFDRRITVTTPLQTAGAYLLTAQMADGNTSHIVVWLDDTVIVKKPLADGTFYYVADAATGQPIAKANIELFGYRQSQPIAGKPVDVETVDFADQTDADGQLIVAASAQRSANSTGWRSPPRPPDDSPISASRTSPRRICSTRNTTRRRSSRFRIGPCIGRARR